MPTVLDRASSVLTTLESLMLLMNESAQISLFLGLMIALVELTSSSFSFFFLLFPFFHHSTPHVVSEVNIAARSPEKSPEIAPICQVVVLVMFTVGLQQGGSGSPDVVPHDFAEVVVVFGPLSVVLVGDGLGSGVVAFKHPPMASLHLNVGSLANASTSTPICCTHSPSWANIKVVVSGPFTTLFVFSYAK